MSKPDPIRERAEALARRLATNPGRGATPRLDAYEQALRDERKLNIWSCNQKWSY